MKRIFSLSIAILAAMAAFAQTPEEVLTRMEAEMSSHEKDGLVMSVDIKLPILGTISSTTYTLGNKYRIEANTKGARLTSWSDGVTSWDYDPDKNEVTIEKSKGTSSDSADAEMFSGITDGYDVSFEKQTDSAWHIICRKSRDNKEKDDPKTMRLVVNKSNYYPISLSAKLSGVTMTMHGISFGVTEDQVTFNPDKYPGVKIIDKR